MTTSNKYFAMAGLCFIIMAVMVLYKSVTILQNRASKTEFKQDRANFKNGEILLPDYAHTDTIVVMDADGLNEAIEKVDGSDGEIDSVLRLFCVPF